MQTFNERVNQAIDELRQGKMVILTDHQDREDEGDIIFPADIVTPEVINFMIRYCSGIICLSLPTQQLQKLHLSPMVPADENNSQRETPFTTSIEAKYGVTTGVSAQDRTTTILTAIKKRCDAR